MPATAWTPHAGDILIVDDEPQIRRAVRNALVTLSDRVVEAATGSVGLALAASVPLIS
jgi:CheY-like chemotaxis protein